MIENAERLKKKVIKRYEIVFIIDDKFGKLMKFLKNVEGD